MGKGKTILVANPGLDVVAGGQGVTAWALQALVDSGYAVSFATLWKPNFDLMNEAFGTDIRSDCLRVEVAPARYRAFIRSLPTRGASMELALTERFTASLFRRYHYDLLIGMNNEMNFPVPGLQYIHYPRFLLDRPEDDFRWFHRIPGILKFYRHAASWVSKVPEDAWRENRSLINSKYIASLFDGQSEILYPPVAGEFNLLPWSRRKNRFVVLGRLHEIKRIVPMIHILKAVHRLPGIPPFEVVFVGQYNCSQQYRREIEALIEGCEWIQLRHDIDRAALSALLSSSRFGIHGMHGEHFGMAVAEMQEAGMIVFAPNSGGPREILSYDHRRLYDSDNDAISKITTVLEEPMRQHEIHKTVLAEAGRFLLLTFCQSFLQSVGLCLADQSMRPSTAPVVSAENATIKPHRY